jgi:hypothetical protein
MKAHEEAQVPLIEARVIQCSLEEAKWLAVEANLHHGVPLSA